MSNVTLINTRLLIICLLVSVSNRLFAQDSLKKEGSLSWNAFADVYYSYDFAKPADHVKAPFVYNHNRHNEVAINLAVAGLSYKAPTKRANIALMAGTYPQYNLAAEPALIRHIYEANAGVKLARTKEIWLDAGILPSHIGFESAISKDCWTLTRSILAENSPYYEAGVRASYKSPNEKWYLAALFLNGWQRIQRVDGNNTPSFGTQLTFTPTDKLSLNSSTFVGSDNPDSVRKWRYFHNLYAIWQLSKQWGITMGFDVGFEQKQKHSSQYHAWYSPVMILRYQSTKWAVAARAEFYQDKAGVIVALVNNKAFQMQGYSLNVDRMIGKEILFRMEGRVLKNASDYFINRSSLSPKNYQLTSSLCFSF